MITIPGMDAFAALSRQAQLGALRRLGRNALGRYGVEDARLRLERYEHNATFRVEARGGPYLLRINRPGVHTPETISSELAWLVALRRDTALAVPEPIPAQDGSFVVVASDERVPEPRICVLLRWLDGRFVNQGLAPAHLSRVGELAGRLQAHAARWTPSAGFLRPRVDTLTNSAKLDSIAGSADEGEQPTGEDADHALWLVATLVSSDAASLVARALDVVRVSTRALADEADGVGLIHADLHYNNVLFDGGEPGAIDFDDCGWGLHLYDLAVTLSELEGRPLYDELRDACLAGYAGVRFLPADHAVHLAALILLRRVQNLLWVLESREHSAFRDRWQRWAREELDAIAARLSE
jgi:Ser/Thr protein kinase RdoA (MazF antagonist)